MRLCTRALLFPCLALGIALDASALGPSETDKAAAETARWLVHNASWGVLTTLKGGVPDAEVFSFADGDILSEVRNEVATKPWQSVSCLCIVLSCFFNVSSLHSVGKDERVTQIELLQQVLLLSVPRFWYRVDRGFRVVSFAGPLNAQHRSLILLRDGAARRIQSDGGPD
jgi:hypothetical protein